MNYFAIVVLSDLFVFADDDVMTAECPPFHMVIFIICLLHCVFVIISE